MRNLLTLAFALLVSVMIAAPVQLQIAVAFNADLEFVLAMGVLFLFCLVAILALGLALLRSVPAIDRTALALASFVLSVALALAVFSAALAPSGARARDLPLLVQIAAPSLLAILVQWWLVRRRRVRQMKG